MQKTIDRRVVIIRRNTRLDDLAARFNTVSQAKFYVEHLGSSFDDYEAEHAQYNRSLQAVKMKASAVARIHLLDRTFLPNFIFAESDIIAVVGQDGLVANTLKYLKGQPTIGINPDRQRWDGVLLPFDPSDLSDLIRDISRDKREIKDVTMGKLNLQNGQELLAVNDFFIGQRTHASARYCLRYQGKEENQSSSGIIVSTGLGSSGWMRSVLAGASGIMNAVSHKKLTVKGKQTNIWGSDHLTFSVREPFPSRTTGTDIVFGTVSVDDVLSIVSHMGENGVIFSDGIEKDFLEFNSGMEARITVADIKGRLVV